MRNSGQPQSGARNRPPIMILGGSVLDRFAYRVLLRVELGREASIESDFAPTSVWTAMRQGPAIVLVDTDRPDTAALDAVQMINHLHPETRILVVASAVDPAHVQPWSRCQIHGYVVKDGGIEELRAAFAALADGRSYFSEGVRSVIRRTRGTAANADSLSRLSPREAELLPLLARGMKLRDAAEKMTVSYKTADSYRTSLMRKLGLRDRVELARFAIRKRIIEP